ncbi:MAG: hypothetical protein ACJ8BW_32110 [Ktedonobacteraceae bacterium]
MSSRRQSGEVSTDLKRFPGIAYKGPCHAYITLIEGKVVSCIVQDQEGKTLIDGERALQGLKGLGQLEWTWSTVNLKSVPAAPAQRNPPDMSSIIPRRIVPLEMIDRNTLPRRHWQILLLIDGSRTATRIASVLSISPSSSELQEVIRILQDLHQRGIIVAMNT